MADNTSEMKEDKSGDKALAPGTVSDESVKLKTQITLMKSSFDASFENLMAIQELHEKMLKGMLKKDKYMQADSVKKLNYFIENAIKGRDEYRKVMEEGFNNIEELFITDK